MIINFQEVIFGGGSVRKKIFLVIYEIFVHDRVNIFLFEIFDFLRVKLLETKFENNVETREQKYCGKQLESNKEEIREETYRETREDIDMK